MFYSKRNSGDGACTSMFFGVTATPSAVLVPLGMKLAFAQHFYGFYGKQQ